MGEYQHLQRWRQQARVRAAFVFSLADIILGPVQPPKEKSEQPPGYFKVCPAATAHKIYLTTPFPSMCPDLPAIRGWFKDGYATLSSPKSPWRAGCAGLTQEQCKSDCMGVRHMAAHGLTFMSNVHGPEWFVFVLIKDKKRGAKKF